MTTLIYLGFLCIIAINYITLWSMTRYLHAQDQSIEALTNLVLAIAKKHIQEKPTNVIPINLKKT